MNRLTNFIDLSIVPVRKYQFILPIFGFLSMWIGGNGQLGEFGLFSLIIGMPILTMINVVLLIYIIFRRREQWWRHTWVTLLFVSTSILALGAGWALGGLSFL